MPADIKYTAVDDRGRCFLVLPVAVVEDDVPPEEPDDTRWCAHVCDPASPLAGLYAFATSFDAARDSVAETAWAAVRAGELTAFAATSETLAGIYVVATTCETYDAEALNAAIADDAA